MGSPFAPECDGIRGDVPGLDYGSAVGKKMSNVVVGSLPASCVGKVRKDRLKCHVIEGSLQV